MVDGDDYLGDIMLKLKRDRFIYRKSSEYYKKLNRYITIPAIVLTGSCSIASFFSSSDLIDPSLRNKFSLSIGMLTSITTILQSISNSCNFYVKKTQFEEISVKIDLLIDKVYFEMKHKDEKDFILIVEEELKEIKQNCNFLPILFYKDIWVNSKDGLLI